MSSFDPLVAAETEKVGFQPAHKNHSSSVLPV